VTEEGGIKLVQNIVTHLLDSSGFVRCTCKSCLKYARVTPIERTMSQWPLDRWQCMMCLFRVTCLSVTLA